MHSKTLYSIFITLAIISIAIFLTVKYRFTPNADINNKSDEARKADSTLFAYDLEQSSDLKNYNTVSTIKSKSGTKGAMLNDTIEYSVTFSKKVSEIPDFNFIKEVKVDFQLFCMDSLKEAAIVLAIDGPDGKSVHWSGSEIYGSPGQWTELKKTFPLIGSYITKDSDLKLFIWNKKKEVFYLDDIRITFK